MEHPAGQNGMRRRQYSLFDFTKKFNQSLLILGLHDVFPLQEYSVIY
jgi:hypothetical protein